MRRRLANWVGILSLLCASNAFGGLALIEATDTEIRLHLEAVVDGEVRIIEIEPYDKLNPLRGLMIDQPDCLGLNLSNKGFLRLTFPACSGRTDPQLTFPDYPVNAEFVDQLSIRVRVPNSMNGEGLPIRIGDGADYFDLILPADGEWHVLRADMNVMTWEGINTLQIKPVSGREVV